MTDSVRGPRGLAVREPGGGGGGGRSMSTSERSSPQPNGGGGGGAYFPPTMVAHPLFNSAGFRLDRATHSPDAVSDGYSDYDADAPPLSVRAPYGALHARLIGGGGDGGIPRNCVLNHAHLRKAKLM